MRRLLLKPNAVQASARYVLTGLEEGGWESRGVEDVDGDVV